MGVSTSLSPCSRHCGDEESRLIPDVLIVLPLLRILAESGPKSRKQEAPDRSKILSGIGAHAHAWGVDHRQEHLFTALVPVMEILAFAHRTVV